MNGRAARAKTCLSSVSSVPPWFVFLLALLAPMAGCTPTVAVEAPKEPITINLNIKLDADVKLRVEEKAKEDVQSKSIF